MENAKTYTTTAAAPVFELVRSATPALRAQAEADPHAPMHRFENDVGVVMVTPGGVTLRLGDREARDAYVSALRALRIPVSTWEYLETCEYFCRCTGMRA